MASDSFALTLSSHFQGSTDDEEYVIPYEGWYDAEKYIKEMQDNTSDVEEKQPKSCKVNVNTTLVELPIYNYHGVFQLLFEKHYCHCPFGTEWHSAAS